MSRLLPCSRCARHVRKADARCPFCGADQSLLARPPVEGFTSLAPLVAAAVALAGCNESAPTTTTPTSVVTTDLSPVETTTPTATTPTATATATETAPTAAPTASAVPTTSASGPTPLPTATLIERPAKPMYGMPPPQDRPRMKYGMPKM